MENNKREWPPVRRPRRRGINVRPIALLLALVLLIGGAVGGVVAWLIDQTDPIANTFTVSNIDITLAETKSDFKMIPGCTIAKDPKVTVTGGSEDCWLFVEVTESDNLKDFISYEVTEEAGAWTKLEDGVYYRHVAANAADQTFAVLKDNMVTVLEDVTKEDMDSLKAPNATQPTLTFTAYAVQYYKTNGVEMPVADAWALAKPVTP